METFFAWPLLAVFSIHQVSYLPLLIDLYAFLEYHLSTNKGKKSHADRLRIPIRNMHFKDRSGQSKVKAKKQA